VWLTGLPSAGKTTLATALAARLDTARVELLDGDEVREFLSKGLGFSREDRDTNVLRILYAKQRSGELTGLTGVDAPYEPPTAPAAVVRTQEQSLEESVEQLHVLLQARGLA